MTSYLLSQKEKLREYRREYLSAIAQNDSSKANSIQNEYKREYPEFGPLQVKKSDIRAYRNRQTRTRIERVIAGMPKDTQPLFRELAAMVTSVESARSLNDGGEYMDVILGR